MRSILIFLLIFLSIKTACAQTVAADSLTALYAIPDSAELVRAKFKSDSLTKFFITPPDANRKNLFMDSVIKANLYTGYAFLDVHHHLKKTKVQPGKTRNFRSGWILVVILILLLYLAVLNRLMSKSILDIVESFYSQRVLSQFSKEENLLNSWSFIALFLLFGATIGMLFYQITAYYNHSYTDDGWQLYLGFAFAAIIFFILKIILLRILGLIFNIRNLVKEYISILYLTYFNVTFMSLPVVVCFGLIADRFKPVLLLVCGMLFLVVLLWQYIRGSINILSGYRFSKVYLFIYLCALEFCPVIILIKALKL